LTKAELLALTWEDIDYDKKLLNVNKSRTGSRKNVTMQITTPKTKSSNRKIPINDFVIGELKAEKQRQEEYSKLLDNGYDKSHSFIVRTVLGKPYVNLSCKSSDRERRLAALYDSRLSPFCGEYSRRQRRTDSGHLRFARTRKRTDHRENLYQPSKDRKGDDDKRSRQRYKFEHRIKVV
jgi:integrase